MTKEGKTNDQHNNQQFVGAVKAAKARQLKRAAKAGRQKRAARLNDDDDNRGQ